MSFKKTGIGCKESCGGSCCKYIITGLDNVDFDLKYIEGRGGIIRNGWVLFPSRCKGLTKNGKCEIHDQKPRYCKSFPTEMSAWLLALGCKYFDEVKK
jgi:Fe-S-cluster containining protein